MSDTAKLTRPGITVRLDPDVRDRIQRIEAGEHRSIAGYVQMLIERDLRARDEAEPVIYVFTAPELEGEAPGILQREEGETDERYEARAEALRILFGET
ncbi:MAG: hypothetical protein EXR07_08450 [Acetobacteraceae bacterium]|nr:hypothetical protein [Acetobacteraceae bacterium]